jgi:FkbH-like protein
MKGELAALLRGNDGAFWPELSRAVQAASSFEELTSLGALRKRAEARGLPDPRPRAALRLAMIGGYSLYPLRELVSLSLWAAGFEPLLFAGEYDNHVAEILEPSSELYRFEPEVVFVLPPGRRCRYEGALTDPREAQQAGAQAVAAQLLDLCRALHERSRAEVILANFIPPAGFDLGPLRAKVLGSGWAFHRAVNLALGLDSPPFVQICDLELLASRRGLLASRDARRWFESKQPFAPELMPDVAREVAHVAASLRRSPKKVLVLDLDNTLWGGVVGDDGLDGIEIGDTSPRGEAFKAFQAYIASLKERGVLLAVCSKNDHDRAAQAFLEHPEMVLKMTDFVAFKASWGPKSESLRQIAAELELGLDSLVFVDDNPAEIDIVRQFVPEVTTILLGPDPAEYRATLEDCRLFEPRSLTAEDAQRSAQYQREAERRTLLASVTDMDGYLTSLEMEGTLLPFRDADVPRIAQLVNKSNQFNLTTRRRSEAEVTALVASPDHESFTVRLRDRFGDHGLIAVVVGRVEGTTFHVDTWLMSCRVLKRQVEEATVNEIVRLALRRGATLIRGAYLPTAKNGMVRDLYAAMGFSLVEEQDGRREFALDPRAYATKPTRIRLDDTPPGRTHEPG